MASLALHLRSHHTLKPSITLLKFTPYSLYFSSSSSSSSSSNNNEKDNNENNTFSSHFDTKSNLKQQQQSIEPYPFATSLASIKSKLTHHRQQPQSTKEGFSPSVIASLGSSSSSNPSQNDGIRRNLSEFRRPSTSAEKTKGINFQAVKDSLKGLGTTKTGNRGNNIRNTMSFNYNNSNFRPQWEMADHGGANSVFGGGELPLGVFGKEMKEKKEGKDDNGWGEVENWMGVDNVDELGKKLRELRPKEKGMRGGFSLSELNERLKKVKEIDDKEMAAKKGPGYVNWRKSLRTMKVEPKSNSKMGSIQVFDILGPGTPSFMLSPLKEHLVEKYFHPDNMSAEEKLKLELKKVREEFKMHESDCGSARVQVAQLTTEILHLSSVLHKKDKHSRRGLQAKVQQRKKLLKYLRRTDWESYCFVLSKLGLRDNPDYKN